MTEIINTNFDKPVGGKISQVPAGCEFGIQGECWTQDGYAYLERESPGERESPDGHHVHIGEQIAIPGAAADVSFGCMLPDANVPFPDRFIQLSQCTPEASKIEPAKVVEVRFWPNRSLSIGVFRGPESPHTRLAVPVDGWFDVTFHMERGEQASLWLTLLDDVGGSETVGVIADTRKSRSQGQRQTLGGTFGTLGPFRQVVDYWRIEAAG